MRHSFLLMNWLFCFCVLFLSAPGFASDPNIEWRVLHTPHFEFIYDHRYPEQAKAFAVAGETAYKTLATVFSEVNEKTTVLISDTTDSANGFASFLPYPAIVVFPVMPDSTSELTSYDDWALELMIHELTHIFSMKPSNSFYIPLRWVFGSVIRPNAVLPRWFLEGVAVEMESRWTLHGRLRSPYTSAAIRADVEANTWGTEDLARINEGGIPTYPYGARPYFYGSLVWKFMTDEKGVEVVDRLHQNYSRRLPFFLNGPAEEAVGLDYSQILQAMYQKTEERARRQLIAIERQGKDTAQVRPIKGLSQYSPNISPDGMKMLFRSFTPGVGSELWLIEKTSKDQSFSVAKVKKLFITQGFQSAGWAPDSSRFVFERVDVWKTHYRFSDLYIYDLKTNKSERLTRGERASQAEFSPSGKKIIYVKVDGGQNELKVLDLANKESRGVYRPELFHRIANPHFLSESEVVFSLRDRKGTELLHRFSLEAPSNEPKVLLRGYSDMSQARRTSRGLFFTSTSSGVPNLYFMNSQMTSAQALSNTSTAVFDGDLDPHTLEVWTTRMTSQGSQLFVTPKARTFTPPQVTPVVGSLSGWSDKTLEPAQTEIKESSYWPAKYLLPKYWIPFVYPVEGGVLFQGTTGSYDPAKINSYLLDAGFDTVTDKWSYGFSFLNQSFPIGIELGIVEYQDYLGGSNLVLTQRYQSFGFSSYLPYLSENFRARLYGSNAETERRSGKIKRQGVSAGLSYSDFVNSSSSPFYSDGNQLSFLYTKYLEGTQLTAYDKSQASLAHQIKSWFPARHSLLLQLKGSYAPQITNSQLIALGDKTVGGNYLASLINSSYLMRGYPSGTFVGRSLVNMNIEYKFPLGDIYKGYGTFPWFWNKLDTAFFIDGVGVDGAFQHRERGYLAADIEDSFWSSGLELRLNTTAAYHLPLDITLGLYYGFDQKAQGGFTTFLSLGYTPHEGVSHLK